MNHKEVRRSAVRFIPGVLVVLFSVGLIVLCAAAIRADRGYRENQESYEAVRKLANAVSDGEQVGAVVLSKFRSAAHRPTPPADPSKDVIALPDIQEEALRKINPEYCFWIYIPGTRINYPVARHCDNQFTSATDLTEVRAGAAVSLRTVGRSLYPGRKPLFTVII